MTTGHEISVLGMLQWLTVSPEIDSARSPGISTLLEMMVLGSLTTCHSSFLRPTSLTVTLLLVRQWSSFRVDHHWNSTMPLKPTKVWVAADSTNSYFSRFEVYTGRNNTTEHGLGARVVKTLTSDLKGRHHHVYSENCFSTLKFLELGDIYAWRKNHKGFSPQLKKPNLKNKCVYVSVCIWACVCI